MQDSLVLVTKNGASASGGEVELIYLPITEANMSMRGFAVLLGENVVGDGVFELRKNGVLVPEAVLTIPNGSRSASLEFFDIALAVGDEFVLVLTSGTIVGPVTLTIQADDGIMPEPIVGDISGSSVEALIHRFRGRPVYLAAPTFLLDRFTGSLSGIWTVDQNVAHSGGKMMFSPGATVEDYGEVYLTDFRDFRDCFIEFEIDTSDLDNSTTTTISWFNGDSQYFNVEIAGKTMDTRYRVNVGGGDIPESFIFSHGIEKLRLSHRQTDDLAEFFVYRNGAWERLVSFTATHGGDCLFEGMGFDIIVENTDEVGDPGTLAIDNFRTDFIVSDALANNVVMKWKTATKRFEFEPEAQNLIPLSYLDTDGTLAANSDVKLATQKAIKTYVDALLAANDAMVFKGVIDASANPNYPAASAGHTYKISVAGKIGGASGVAVEVGDFAICIVDGTAAGNQATVGANWSVVQVNTDGQVIGPASATNNAIALFDGTTGKLIKNSAVAISTDGTAASDSDAKVMTEKAVRTYVAANSGGGSAAIGVSLAKTAVQAINNATWTTVSFDVEVTDDAAFHDNTTNNSRITIPTGQGGWYNFLGQLSFAATSSGGRAGRLIKNGNAVPFATVLAAAFPDSGVRSRLQVNGLIKLAAGDYVELQCYHSIGGSYDLEYVNNETCFHAVKV